LFERICDQTTFEEAQAQKISHDLFSALAYMHSKGVAHRDLKPENLLFADESEEALVKIADFGFAVMSKKGNGRRRMRTAIGTQGYSAPEVFFGKEYTEKCDVWSMGVIVHILLCGLPPFIEIDEEEIEEAFNCPFWVYVNQMIKDPEKLKLEFHPKLWGHVSEGAKDFLKQIFIVDPDLRPSAAELIKHSWITGKSRFRESTNDLQTTMHHLRKFKRKDVETVNSPIGPNSKESTGLHSRTSSGFIDFPSFKSAAAQIKTPKGVLSMPSISEIPIIESEDEPPVPPLPLSTPPPRGNRPRNTFPNGIGGDNYTTEEKKSDSLKHWDEEKVANWMLHLGSGKKWGEYAKICRDQGIDGFTLLHANLPSLIELGISPIHARAVVAEVAETLAPFTIVPPKPGNFHGSAFSVNGQVLSVPIFEGPGYNYRHVGTLGKGSIVHALAEQVHWIRHRLGWSPRRDQNRRTLLDKVTPEEIKSHGSENGSRISDAASSDCEAYCIQLLSFQLMYITFEQWTVTGRINRSHMC